MTQLPPDHDPSETQAGAVPDQSTGEQLPPQGWQPPPQYAPPAQGYPQGDQQQTPYGYPQPGYPQYGSPVGGQFPPPAPPMNILAVIGFVGVFFSGLVGVILGHIALSKIKRSGEGGRGFALAAVIIGYVRVALTVLGTIAFFAFIGMFGAFSSTVSGPGSSWAEPYSEGEHSEREGLHGEEFSEQWNQRFSEMPWIGTASEELCTAMFAPEVSIFEDAEVYYTGLIGVSEDPELTALIEKMLVLAQANDGESADRAEERAEAEQEWAEASSEMAIICMGEEAPRG